VTAALWHRLPANFEEQLEVLAPRVAELHFDDGYVDVVRAAEALEARGRRGVFFVVPGWLNRSGVTTARRIAELVRRGHEIGNHTWSHPDLRRLSLPAQRLELVRARDRLAEITGSVPRRLAWPFGLHDGRSDAIAAELGYESPRGITSAEIFAPRLKTAAQLKRIPRRVFAGEADVDDEDLDE
jgi:peptidoglycan/xylan/chitin deacetylase (PgdA/CDA1 family)